VLFVIFGVDKHKTNFIPFLSSLSKVTVPPKDSLSIDEERLLRRLVEEGKGANRISEVMGKTRISVRAKMYSLGLSVKEATAEFCRPVAAAVAVVSSPEPIADTALVENLDGAEDVAAELETNRPLPSIEQKLRAMQKLP
jgi:hypothetical protein